MFLIVNPHHIIFFVKRYIPNLCIMDGGGGAKELCTDRCFKSICGETESGLGIPVSIKLTIVMIASNCFSIPSTLPALAHLNTRLETQSP